MFGVYAFDKQFSRHDAWRYTEQKEDLSLTDSDFYLKDWDIQEAQASFNLIGDNGELQPIELIEGQKDGSINAEKAYKQLFVPLEEGNLAVSHVFGDSYYPLSNEMFLTLIESSLKACSLPMDVQSVGSIHNRKRVFVSVSLPETEDIQSFGGRKWVYFLNFINSFDGSTPFMANTSNTCIDCSNSYNANLREGGALIKHTKNMESRIESLPRVINEALTVQKQFANDFLKLHNTTISSEHAEKLFYSFLSLGSAKLSTRSYNIADRLTELFKTGKGNKGETLADVFSALTDYYSHESAGGDCEQKQFVSSEFGNGADKKRNAMQFLMKCNDVKAERKRQLDRGAELVKAYLDAKSE